MDAHRFFVLWGFGLQVCLQVFAHTAAVDRITQEARDAKNITAEPGDNVTLSFKVPRNISNFALELTRPDLKPGYVFFYRDGQFNTEVQHPSFFMRVELTDKQIKDGDFSVILKNANVNDTGTFKFYVRSKEKGRELIRTIHLKVKDSGGGAGHTGDGGEMRGHVGLIAAVSVFIVVVVFIISVIIFSQLKRYMKKISPPSLDEAATHKLCSHS